MKNMIIFLVLTLSINVCYSEITKTELSESIISKIDKYKNQEYVVEYIEYIGNTSVNIESLEEKTSSILEKSGISKSDKKYNEFYENQIDDLITSAKNKIMKRKVINTLNYYISSYYPISPNVESSIQFNQNDIYFIYDIHDKINKRSFQIDRQFKNVIEFSQFRLRGDKNLERTIFPEYYLFWIDALGKEKENFSSLISEQPLSNSDASNNANANMQKFSVKRERSKTIKNVYIDKGDPNRIKQYTLNRDENVLSHSYWFGELEIENSSTIVPKRNILELYDVDGFLQQTITVDIYSCKFGPMKEFPADALSYIKNQVDESYRFERRSKDGQISQLSYDQFFK